MLKYRKSKRIGQTSLYFFLSGAAGRLYSVTFKGGGLKVITDVSPSGLFPEVRKKNSLSENRPAEMADGARFELARGFRPLHTFQACAFNRSAIHPQKCFQKMYI